MKYFAHFNPLTSHLPFLSFSFSAPSSPLSLPPSPRCGCTWYSLACLSSRRLDSSNLLQEPRALLPIIHCTKPDRAALKPPLFFAAFCFPLLRICYFSKVRPRPPFLCPPVSLPGVDAQRKDTAAAASAGRVSALSVSPSLRLASPPSQPTRCSRSSSRSRPGLVVPAWRMSSAGVKSQLHD